MIVNDVPVVAGIPWRATENRLPAMNRVLRFFAHFGVPVMRCDSDPSRPFNLSAARNECARRIRSLYGDDTVIIISDADTIPDAGALLNSINNVSLASDLLVSYPHGSLVYLHSEHVDERDLSRLPSERSHHGHSVSAPPIVMRASTFFAVGGFDERFTGWGAEDDAFAIAAAAFGTVERTDDGFGGTAVAYSFDTEDSDRRLSDSSRARYQLYLNSRHCPEMVRELIMTPAQLDPGSN